MAPALKAIKQFLCVSSIMYLFSPYIGHCCPNHQLIISIAATAVFIIFFIIVIITGYCCYLYGHKRSNRMLKSLNPHALEFARNMTDNHIYHRIKTLTEKNRKSLRQISKSKIRYVKDLGSGTFALVYQGKVEGIIEGEDYTTVAIKTLREGTSAEGMKNFLHAAKLASQFNHENIIKLYGICMSATFYCLVFKYMDLGDLNKFLCTSANSQQCIINSLDTSARSRTESSLSNNPPQLNTQQLLSICYQIALGMTYLSSLKHIHCDLAYPENRRHQKIKFPRY